jgi:hypothetical protein
MNRPGARYPGKPDSSPFGPVAVPFTRRSSPLCHPACPDLPKGGFAGVRAVCVPNDSAGRDLLFTFGARLT